MNNLLTLTSHKDGPVTPTSIARNMDVLEGVTPTGPDLNVFRVVADLSHTASKCILIWAIHSNKSAEGVSLLTQLLYILVFGTRYLDLLWVPPYWSWYNTSLKIFYTSSSLYIVWLMMRMYARTREREYAWKLAAWSLAGSLVSAPIVCLILAKWKGRFFTEVRRSSISEICGKSVDTDATIEQTLWTFSIILESICVLPQLLLLRQTSVPTVLDSFYLVTLGSYRFLYILNWIYHGAIKKPVNPIAVIFGVIQTALYIDFAWVYWSRQRVKLRGGGVVDSDDLSKSFLVRRIIGHGSRADHEDEDEDLAEEDAALAGQENGTARNQPLPKVRAWGGRGISVSADDTLHDHQGGGSYADNTAAGDAQMIDPAHFEDDDDDDADAPPPPVPKDGKYKPFDASEGIVGGPADINDTTWAQNTGEEHGDASQQWRQA